MGLLDRQASVTPQRGMPVEDHLSSSAPITISGETVLLYYSNAGVRTVDAGQAAAVAVEGVLLYRPVMGASGVLEATVVDTSLSFTSTAFTTEVPFPAEYAEGVDASSWASRLAAITTGFTNGQYCVDYAKGVLYGVKASTQVSLTAATYKILGRSTDAVTVANTPAILSPTTGDTVIAANASRRGFMVQNLGTNALFVRLGASATTSVFHAVLKGGSGTDDGTGGSYSMMDGAVYTGAVSVAGTSPRLVITEV